MSTTRQLDVKTYLRAVSEETQTEAAARFQSAIRGTPVFLSLQDRDLRYTWMHNPIASIATGSTIGKNDWDIFEPEDAAKLTTLKQEVLDSTIGSRHELEITIGGAAVWFDLILSPLLGRDGSLIGVSTTAIDISTRRELEIEREKSLEALNRAKEHAEEMSRAKDHFLARLSHELRTPLTPVLSLLDAYLGEKLSDAMRGLMATIRRNVELEARLIDDLLDHTRIVNGKLRLQLEHVSIHELLESVLDICRGDIENKELTISVRLEATHPMLIADPARLQQVLWNIVKNAVKFTPVGGSISIQSTNNDGEVVIEVRDSGAGIDAELLPTIFDAFRQGDHAPGGNTVGLGLGLAISKSLVDLHGGRLMAMSEGRDRGATFTLGMKTIDSAGHDVHGANAHAAIGRSVEGNTILLVEDHADTAMMMKLLLERKGFQVNVAPNMTDALDIAGREHFDLLISDIGLPDGSGIELMNVLTKRRPVKGIALSGFGMEEDIKRSIEAGFAEHLIKPVSYQKLREAIQRLLS